ncbi:MAG TPA: peptidase M1 [Cryomorphaceae bacterium]|nr:peptidase M1 [Cryomorphaceae bacterium]
MKKFLLAILATCAIPSFGQYWQQAVDYHIQVALDDQKHQLAGDLSLRYTNNSPDVLDEVYFHLYWNAFQPGSMLSNMANIPTKFPDRAIGSNVENYAPDEYGEQIVQSLTLNGQPVAFVVDQTILHCTLPQGIHPGETVTFAMTYTTRIPKLVERAGRDNPEGIAYSFTQWYPKMVVYDTDGWHPDIYVAREFFGDFGTFNVDITAPASYMIGGSGVLQNPDQIGHGYSAQPVKFKKKDRITWRFKAEKVHDFAWVADKELQHDLRVTASGLPIHFFYQNDTASSKHMSTDKFQAEVEAYFAFMHDHFGSYDWPQFSVIQGGEGAMEYPMATIMQVHGGYDGLLGTVVHEASHMWFYGMLGTDEQRYYWMDEGFTSFAEDEAMNVLSGKNLPNAHLGYLGRYSRVAHQTWMEPASTLANYFDGKFPYQMAAYMKGSLFLVQLRGIMGEDAFWSTLQRYKNVWAFKHPRPENFLRIAEQESGMVLDWYMNQWIETMKVPDAGVDSVYTTGGNLANIRLTRNGSLALPVDVDVVLKNGTTLHYTVPLSAMFGHKDGFALAGPWNYTQKTFTFQVAVTAEQIARVVVDPASWTADANRDDNVWEAP